MGGVVSNELKESVLNKEQAPLSNQLEQRCTRLIENLGLGQVDQIKHVHELTGGVASDIAHVELPTSDVCVKFALNKLKVADNWCAPIRRGKAEYAWLSAVSKLVPGHTPELLGWSEQDNGFAMEFVSGSDVYLWKEALLSQAKDHHEAEKVAYVLVQIHAVSAQPDFDTAAFRNQFDFLELRLEPYLNFTADKHPQIKSALYDIADDLFNADTVLIHGDVSPKNILFQHGQPVFLDAECTTMGDPAFDVSFCLNHLLLKALHLPESRNALFDAAERFWQTYSQDVDWENIDGLEKRIATLLPALMLARVDGKSPVEYLSATEQECIRKLSIPLIIRPVSTLADLINIIKQQVSENE